ncbi:MAG TPA: CHASE2 domain-containing protein [Candidatus Dojkabacteria bacterium]|nr:CHASE2 domain-containing protein [Candidatus Dojkabacteria bacterium]
MFKGIYKQTKNLSYFLIGLATTIFMGLISNSPFFTQINNLIVDRFQGVNKAREEVVIVSIDDASLQEVGAWPWSWDMIALLLDKIAENEPTVLSTDILLLETREGRDVLEKVVLENKDVPFVFASKLVDSTIIKPDITADNLYTGFVNFSTDIDGKIRRTYVGNIFPDGTCEPSLAAKTFAIYSRSDPDFCGEELNLRNITANRAGDGSLIFSYSDDKFEKISAKDVLTGKFSRDTFADKIVLVGSTAVDLRSNLNDNFFSVTGQALPGVEIHANILNSFLNNQFHSEVNAILGISIIGVFNLISLYFYKRTRSNKQDLIIFFFLLIGTTIVGVFLFEFKINWGIIFTLLAVITNYVYMIAYKYLTERMQKQFIEGAFGRYINPKLLEQLERHPDLLKLGGERKEMTVFFSDIRGFTSLSEKMDPNKLLDILNTYLGRASEIILKNEGTIDKFIGDEIMVFWNAPLSDPDHRTKALKTAIEISDELERFNLELENELPHLYIGIGINTGDMVVGNIGGAHRIDYTVLGDNVNIGSRLQGLTKHYRAQIIVSATTLEGVDLEALNLDTRILDRITVKGRKLAMDIYQVFERSKAHEQKKLWYQTGFAAYQAKDFDTAKKYFRKLIRKYDDGPSKLLLKHAHIVAKLPGWDGVWHWEEK